MMTRVTDMRETVQARFVFLKYFFYGNTARNVWAHRIFNI